MSESLIATCGFACRVDATRSLRKSNVWVPPPSPTVSRTLSGDSSVVVTVGTFWNQEPWLPGCRPSFLNCSTIHCVARWPPTVPGLRPPMESDEMALSYARKPCAVIAVEKGVCVDALAAVSADAAWAAPAKQIAAVKKANRTVRRMAISSRKNLRECTADAAPAHA